MILYSSIVGLFDELWRKIELDHVFGFCKVTSALENSTFNINYSLLIEK